MIDICDKDRAKQCNKVQLLQVAKIQKLTLRLQGDVNEIQLHYKIHQGYFYGQDKHIYQYHQFRHRRFLLFLTQYDPLDYGGMGSSPDQRNP